MCRYTKAPETQTALVLNSGGKGKGNFSLLPSTYYVRVLVLSSSDAAVIKAIKEGKTNVDLNIPETPDGGGGDNISL